MPRRKVTDEQVAEIKRRRAAGETLRAIGADLGLCHSVVRYVDQRGHSGPRNQWSPKYGRQLVVLHVKPEHVHAVESFALSLE